jgi:hydrogenase expression/formation protein HypE
MDDTTMDNTLEDERISLAHGNGGRFMRELIENVFAKHLHKSELNIQADAVPIALGDGEVLITTDGFTVQPLEFPGGDIGSLAIHGTINDLAVAGARPMYLTLNAFIEEGLEVETLDRIVASLARAADEAGVKISAGDTKVVRRGEGGGLYLATTGVGVRLPGAIPSMERICDGDVILVSGTVGDHGTAVMLAREEFGLRGDLVSDAAPVMALTETLLELPGLRFMRDPTRGGIASIAHEILRATGLGVKFEATIPVKEQVQAVCDMLGYDPFYLACEGRVVAVVAPDQANEALQKWQSLDEGRDAARIGRIVAGCDRVILETSLGGERFLEELEDDPLPRIC